MANSNSGNGKQPPWYFDFAVKFGAIAVVGIYLVWWITSALDRQIDAIRDTQQQQISGLQAQNKELTTLREALDEQTSLLSRELDQHMRMLEVIRYSQYQICVNGLKDGMDTRACLGGPNQAHAPRQNRN